MKKSLNDITIKLSFLSQSKTNRTERYCTDIIAFHSHTKTKNLQSLKEGKKMLFYFKFTISLVFSPSHITIALIITDTITLQNY